MQTGVSTEQDRTTYAAAATTLANANAAKVAAIESFFLAATAGLAPERVTTLRNLAANRAWEVPLKYRTVAQHTEAQWVNLREALAHVEDHRAGRWKSQRRAGKPHRLRRCRRRR